MKKWKKRILYAAIISFLMIESANNYEYHEEYEILEDDKAFAKYRDGKIYIGKKSFLELVESEEGDIKIKDERKKEDPNFVVYDSYKVKDKEARNDIIEVLLEYEKRHPSNWDRTKDSMRLEWYMHNLFHNMKYRLDRTTDVDLNNEDEKNFRNKILQKIFKI